MPDDRPESPDLREEFLVCGAAGYPDPHRPYPNTREEAQRFADEHRRLPKYDPVVKHRLATAWHPLDVALSTPAGPSPEPILKDKSKMTPEDVARYNHDPAPSPREARATPRLHVICADCEGWDATNVSCPHGCGVALKAPFVATPGDDATTKEGR